MRLYFQTNGHHPLLGLVFLDVFLC